MKPEEAISILKSWRITGDKSHEAVDMSIDALEKQIPKKPKYKAEDRFVKNHFTVYPYCPVCEKEVVAGDMHCVQCGQAIDWTEGEG